MKQLCQLGDSGVGAIVASSEHCPRSRYYPGQILIYPMLDHLTPTVAPVAKSQLSISADEIRTFRGARMASSISEERLPYVVPKLLKESAWLTPCYINVGALDLFAGESF